MTQPSIRFDITPWQLSLQGVCRLFDAGHSAASAHGVTLHEMDAPLTKQIMGCFTQHHISGAFAQSPPSGMLQ